MPPGKRTHAVAAADWDPSSAEDRGAPAWHAPEQPLVIVRRNEPSSVNNKDAAKAQQTVLNATLTIDCTQDNAAVQGQLQEANDVLATCSGGPVALVLVYGDDKDSQEALARAAEDLGRAPHAGVKALSIKLAPSTLPTPPRLSADILARVMTALPSVQSLAITGYGRLDPTPETLQGLFKLEVYEMSESAGHHLTSIHLLEPQDAHGAFMMYPKLDILHLTKMVIAAPLNDELLACIVNHGPSITLLTVNDLALVFASGAHWAVEELCVTAPKQRTRLEIEQLMHLPKRAQHGRTTIKLPNRTLHFPAIRPDILLGLSHDIRLRLNEWTIHVDKVTVPNTHELVTTALLRNVLQQLAPMQAPNAVVDLPGWDWDGNMLEVLANELRHLSFANINLIVPLTVAMLGYLYQYGMGINHLKLKSLCLVNDEYTSMPWPWPRVTVTNKRPTDVTQLLRLGNPSGRAPRPSLYLPGGLLFDHETISEVNPGDAGTWFSNIDYYNCRRFRVQCNAEDSVRSLQAMQPVIRAVTSTMPAPTTTTATTTLSFFSLRISEETMTCIKKLTTERPSKHCVQFSRIAFIDCTFPLEPKKYKELATCVTTTVRKWRISTAAHDAKLFNVAQPKGSIMYYICEGINEAREKLDTKPAELTAWAHKQDDYTRIDEWEPEWEHVVMQVYPL